MMRLTFIFGCVLAACSAAMGASTATLEPLAQQDMAGAMRKARLVVQSDLDRAVGAIRLRWQGGGPALLLEAAIEPRGRTELTVDLPAISVQQVYDVSLLPQAKSGRAGASTAVAPLEVVQASISWPAEVVNADPFTYYRYDQAQVQAPTMPRQFKINLLLALVMVSLALAGLLLVPRPWLRAALLVVVLAGGAVAVIFIARTVEPVEIREVTLPRLPMPGRLLSVAARKTTTWHSPRLLVPAYQWPRQMQRDNSTIIDGRRMVVPMKAGEVRLFLEPERQE